jgi:hypothetical protein
VSYIRFFFEILSFRTKPIDDFYDFYDNYDIECANENLIEKENKNLIEKENENENVNKKDN